MVQRIFEIGVASSKRNSIDSIKEAWNIISLSLVMKEMLDILFRAQPHPPETFEFNDKGSFLLSVSIFNERFDEMNEH